MHRFAYIQLLTAIALTCTAGYWVSDFGRVGSVGQTRYLTRFRVLTCVFIMALFLQSNTISANHKCLNDVKSRNVMTSQETETADINPRFRFLMTSRRFWNWRYLGYYCFLSGYRFGLGQRVISRWVGLALWSKKPDSVSFLLTCFTCSVSVCGFQTILVWLDTWNGSSLSP